MKLPVLKKPIRERRIAMHPGKFQEVFEVEAPGLDIPGIPSTFPQREEEEVLVPQTEETEEEYI